MARATDPMFPGWEVSTKTICTNSINRIHGTIIIISSTICDMSKPALLNVAIIAANIGAAELEFAVKKVHKLNVMKKGPTDYVTEVDRKVEEIVFDKIREYYPDDNFLGEESGHESQHL